MRKFLWGALIGAGVALLYAPATGATTRSRIRDKATGLLNDAEDMLDSKSRHIRNKMEGYKHKARKMAESVMGPMCEDGMSRDEERMPEMAGRM